MKVQDHPSSIEFWDSICRNLDWEGYEFNNGLHLRLIIRGHEKIIIDYWPTTGKITKLGSNKYLTLGHENIEDFIRLNYLKK